MANLNSYVDVMKKSSKEFREHLENGGGSICHIIELLYDGEVHEIKSVDNVECSGETAYNLLKNCIIGEIIAVSYDYNTNELLNECKCLISHFHNPNGIMIKSICGLIGMLFEEM